MLNIKKNWLSYVIIWQFIGLIVSIVYTSGKENFHGFVYYFMFCLTFTNFIAIFATFLLLLYDRFIKSKIIQKYLQVFSIIAIFAACIFLGNKVVPSIISMVCSAEVAHDVDKAHIYAILINLVIMTVFITTYTTVLIYNKLKTDLQNKVGEIETLNRLQVEAKYALLQSKINPHFLFNTLNSILDLVYKNPEHVEKVILNLSDIYRSVIDLPDRAISIGEELDFVRKYLEVEKVRLGDRLSYNLSVGNNTENFQLPPLIVQTLVENAVIHGISPKKEGGKVSIITENRNGNIILSIIDNGMGIEKNKKSSGFGLRNVRERLEIYFSKTNLVSIRNLDQGGTEIKLILPYEIKNSIS
ncbi:MAG: hypothetical protein GY863_16120 [bacterium]|nr:hypothetical protein [bacterium]